MDGWMDGWVEGGREYGMNDALTNNFFHTKLNLTTEYV